MIEAAREFFALPRDQKQLVHIERSPHYRGYSEMKNSRDWREQIHFGLERTPGGGGFRQLQGPNLWPEALGAPWREKVLAFLDYAARAGRKLLQEMGLPDEDEPYILMKLICYHPQSDPNQPRPGVAAHCDWSWITLLNQDEVGGLQQQREDGAWVDVDAPFSVTVGELAEIATGGRLRAQPHRVVNRSSSVERISIPVFICPPLESVVKSEAAPFEECHGHVHRVRNPAEVWPDFHFGESEWRRKGLGEWCWRPECVQGG